MKGAWLAGIAAVGLAGALPVTALAEHGEGHEAVPRKGGVAEEHHSPEAAENWNPQWSADATQGPERAAMRPPDENRPGEEAVDQTR
jgi:hypothetical protein